MRHVRELFNAEQRGYERILRSLRRLQRWHVRRLRGRPAKRPRALALDTSVLTIDAKAFVDAGGVIDCRNPKAVRFVDPTAEEFRSRQAA